VRNALHKDNIRRAGEEVLPGAPVLRAGTVLDARHIALALAAGVHQLPVWRKPRVALLALHGGADALPHLAVMAALLTSPSLCLTQAGSTGGDGLAVTLARLGQRHDLIIVIGESLTAADADIAGAVGLSGGELLMFRAALKPAKPILAGRMGQTVVVSLAGTAYALTAAAHLFLRPMLRGLLDLPPDDPFLPVVSDFTRARTPGRAEMLPARLRREGNQLVVSQAGRFGQLGALAALDGFALVDAAAGPVAPGDRLLFRPLAMPLV
jgi:molybdopterin molybdotransferase